MIAFLGFGSNLSSDQSTCNLSTNPPTNPPTNQSRVDHLKHAYLRLSQHAQLDFLKTSSLFETPALLPQNSEDDWNRPFLNFVAQIEFTGSLEELLSLTQQVESDLGRQAHKKWSPRIIDIDILSFGNETLQQDKLTVPHAEMLHRNFVLSPFCEVAPTFKLPSEQRTMLELSRKQNPLPIWMHIINLTPDSFSDGNSWQGLNQSDGNNWQSLNHSGDHSRLSSNQSDGNSWQSLNHSGDHSRLSSNQSDGNNWQEPKQLEQLFNEIETHHIPYLDIGAESTRPGATPVNPSEEWNRLAPFLELYQQRFSTLNAEDVGPKISSGLKGLGPKISLDTRYGTTAAKAIEHGCTMINDVSGLSDPMMLEVLKTSEVKYVLMHNLGVPVDKSKTLPLECDPISELKNWFEQKLEQLEKNGIALNRIILDPGIGFGKTVKQNFEILRRIDELHNLKQPLLVGHSRKSFMNVFSKHSYADRNPESIAMSLNLAKKGVEYLRVHDASQHKAAHLATQHFNQES